MSLWFFWVVVCGEVAGQVNSNGRDCVVLHCTILNSLTNIFSGHEKNSQRKHNSKIRRSQIHK